MAASEAFRTFVHSIGKLRAIMIKLVIFIGIVIAIGIFAGRAYKATLRRFDSGDAGGRPEVCD